MLRSYEKKEGAGERQKEVKIDPAKLKKIENAEKLKANLRKKLFKHRQQEIRQMPFDSSKIEFHDKMDMFFKYNFIRRPEEDMAHYLTMQQHKKKKFVKEETKTRDEILFEINEKRKRFASYLQRLECNGATVTLSQADKKMLRAFI